MRLARAESCWRRFWNFGSDHCRYFWSDLSDPKPKLVLSMLRPNRSGFIHSVNLTSYEWRSKQRKREGEIKEREKMGQNFKVEIATLCRKQKKSYFDFLECCDWNAPSKSQECWYWDPIFQRHHANWCYAKYFSSGDKCDLKKKPIFL